MRELLQGYFGELDWSGGATKDALVAHLAGRDEALRTMVNEYVAEGTYQNLDDGTSFRSRPGRASRGTPGEVPRANT
ncbi:MAG: hypothetical protein K0R44_1825 [Thermomicrobiales bacterium]|nr:hypothetical protein [Thermomicrobiales bacterium]